MGTIKTWEQRRAEKPGVGFFWDQQCMQDEIAEYRKQAESAPVAYMHTLSDGTFGDSGWNVQFLRDQKEADSEKATLGGIVAPLYTAPPAQPVPETPPVPVDGVTKIACGTETEFGLQVEITRHGAHVRIFSESGDLLVDQFHEI